MDIMCVTMHVNLSETWILRSFIWAYLFVELFLNLWTRPLIFVTIEAESDTLRCLTSKYRTNHNDSSANIFYLKTVQTSNQMTLKIAS